MKIRTTNEARSDRGIALIETMVVMVLFAVTGLGMAYATVLMSNTRGRNEHNSIASQLAIEGLEQAAAGDPNLLSAASGTSTTIVRSGITFLRAVTIAVEADGSRTATITVTCPGCKLGGEATVESAMPLWGSV